jgi:hypothetical protein
MWRELIRDLAASLIALANTSPEQEAGFPTANFGVFFQRCAIDESWGDEARELLRWVLVRSFTGYDRGSRWPG